MKDITIIGAGPAGLSAAVYAIRAGLEVEVIETEYMPGGQVLTTYEVDNYLGFHGINGFDLGMKFKEHAEGMGIKFKSGKVSEIRKKDSDFEVVCGEEILDTHTVLVATGAENRKLGVEGEARLQGKGVSYCATCDGAFFRGKDAVVIGGSYTAVEDAIYLSALCNKVYLVHRRDKLRAGAFLEKQLFACENVEIIWNSTVEQILGEDKVSGIELKDVKTGDIRELTIDGVFVAVGTIPRTDLLKGIAELDSNGYAIADETCKTSATGIYVAGDLRTKPLRQISTAVADGANATTSIWNYLMESK